MSITPYPTFPDFLEHSYRQFGNRPAISLAGEEPITYSELNSRVKAVVAWLEALGIQQGDKVAILSISIPNWVISYLAIASMGAVAVPILPDFHTNEVSNILEHSGAKAIFVSELLKRQIDANDNNRDLIVIAIEDFSLAASHKSYPEFVQGKTPGRNYTVAPDDLATIIYTSGTTGKSKGVMLTHLNICFTAYQCSTVHHIDENDRFLSVLPLSHSYENTIGLIFPLIFGSCVYFLGKAPSPSVLMPALQVIKPTAMLTVPLIIEKVFRSRVQPKFRKNLLLRLAVHIPWLRKKLNVVAGRNLLKAFGGELRFFGIGGSKLNKTVEKFLIEARFPYAIGYGLTETSPLLAGSNPSNSRLQTTGPALQGVELIIHNPDPVSGEGEIWVKGPNVMKGYYKEPELTAQIITPDGWLRTGDLGVLDHDGFLSIKGRLKNMIVLSGGENIYPEEIETVINNFRHVVDSLVVEQKGKLVALVQFNLDELTEKHHHLRHEVKDNLASRIEELRKELRLYVNHRVNKFSQIQVVIVQQEPFEKTATQKIKRYLYA